MVDPDDFIRAAPAIAKGAAAIGAAIPFTAIVKRMLGPAADELAEMWRDQVRVYRYERQLKCVEKAERMAQEAGFTPQAVPPKILFPLLEGASFEENEDMHTMWAALLANAASPESTEIVRPGFITALRQISTDEAKLLSWVYDLVSRGDDFGQPIEFSEFIRAYSALGFPTPSDITSNPVRCPSRPEDQEIYSCVSGLQAEGLIMLRLDMAEGLPYHYYSLTARGYQFVTACRPPKSKAANG
jgi:hypothetical protein